MYWEKRISKDNKVTFTFAYYNKKIKKTIRLKNTEVPSDINTEEKAAEFCRIKDAEFESVKMRIQKKLEWKNKFYDFTDLLALYEIDMKKKAPNNWKNSMYFLEQYVFPYFLTEKQCNNVNNWHLFYQDFIDWLLVIKPSKGTTNTLSYSTKNHIITALNNFMSILKTRRKVDRLEKCTKFPKHLVKSRDIDDVYNESEVKLVTEKLTEINADYGDLFQVLLNTGLRISECLAISIDDFYVGEPQHETINNALKRHGIECLGYLVIESQLAKVFQIREPNGAIERKPLKGRKVIKSGTGRIIPIFNKDVFNILAKRYNNQLELLKTKKFGSDGKNYLFFDGLNRNTVNAALVKVYEGFNGRFKPKCQHCCRHTFSTNFVGLTNGDFFMAKAILGHKDIETTMRYVHIFEAINRKVKNTAQVRTGIKLLS